MKKPFHPIGDVNNTACITITTREYSGTYIARCNGKSASCTSGAKFAALAVAKKAAQVHIELGIIAEPQTPLHVTDIGPELIAKIRRSICIALEDMGGVNTRLREIEDRQALGNEAEEIEQWLFGASEQLELMAKEVRDFRIPL